MIFIIVDVFPVVLLVNLCISYDLAYKMHTFPMVLLVKLYISYDQAYKMRNVCMYVLYECM